MEIIYIKSGYLGLYSYFDRWIKEVSSETINIIDIQADLNPKMLKNTLLSIKPAFVLLMIGNKNPMNLLKTIKTTNVPIVTWFTEDPFYMDVSLEVLPYSDFILSIDKSACDFYAKIGYKNVCYFPLATNEQVFKPINIEKDIDLLLVGFPYPNRINLMQTIINSKDYSIVIIGKNWDKYLKIPSQKKKKVKLIHQWIPPAEVNHWYNRAKIILNPHRESNFLLNKNSENIVNRSVNNRFFDIVISGNFQLINHQIEIFVDEENERLIRYVDEKDCIKLIHHYINSSINRENIVNALSSKLKRQNTFSNRIKTLCKMIADSYEV